MLSRFLNTLKRVLRFIFYPLIWLVGIITGWINKNFVGLLFTVILLAMAVAVLWNKIVIIIPAGSVGVVYRPLFGGVAMDEILNEGLNIVFPLNTVTQYDTQLQMKQIEMEVLTKDQLRSDIKVSFQYQLNKYALPMLHKYVGPKYLTKIILPEVTGKTRVMFAEISSQEAFTKQLEKVVSDIAITSDRVILEKLGPPGLDNVRLLRITAVQLESMEFPAEIQASIRNKISESQAAEAGVFKVQAARLEAERKEVEAGGIKKYQEIVNSGLTDNYLKIRGIEATLKLAESNNSKVVIFGSSPNGLPIILGGDAASPVSIAPATSVSTPSGKVDAGTGAAPKAGAATGAGPGPSSSAGAATGAGPAPSSAGAGPASSAGSASGPGERATAGTGASAGSQSAASPNGAVAPAAAKK